MLVGLCLVPCSTASAQNYLQPEKGIISADVLTWDYSNQLRQVLLRDSPQWYLARMFCLPSFQPEWVVTVVRVEGKDEHFDDPFTYYVEYAGAEEQIWNPKRKDLENLKVRRSQAPLDKQTAEALNRVWYRMLHASRYPKEPGIGADGVGYHFSRKVAFVSRGRGDPLAGREDGQIWSPDDDTPCDDLTLIGEELKDYAEAKLPDREKYRERLRAKIRGLEKKLDGLRKTLKKRESRIKKTKGRR